MIPFSPPRIDDAIINEVIAALKSGWITTGPRTRDFENKLAEYCGHKSTVCLNSATAGLELMLRWFGVGKGDEVIVPAYTYCATANVVLHCGATPVMVDVNSSDFNINVTAIEKAITNKTKVIIPVDFAGFPCDYEAINALVRDKSDVFVACNDIQKKLGRCMVLADAAHSIGASYKGHKTGSLTDVSVFSFHAVKNLTTAEGGAVCLNFSDFDNAEIQQTVKTKSLHGQNKDALAKTQKGGWEYDVIEPGYKCNMTDIQAAMGLVELNRYEEHLTKRKSIVEKYHTAFKGNAWANLPPTQDKDKESSYHLYALRIKNCTLSQRNEIIEEISQNNVGCNVHFKPLPLLTAYKNRGYSIDHYPVAYANFCCEISLPVYYNLSFENVETIIQVVNTAVEKVMAT